MRLTELEPQWSQNEDKRKQQGLLFLCPKHKNHHLQIWFANPLDKKAALPIRPFVKDDFRWNRTGDSFETLSIDPDFYFAECDLTISLKNGQITVQVLEESLV